MFGKDFYPTPQPVIDQMLAGVEVAGVAVLEPSAGKGNIVDELAARGARQVLTFEKHPELARIVADKSTLVGEPEIDAIAGKIDRLKSLRRQFNQLAVTDSAQIEQVLEAMSQVNREILNYFKPK